MPISHNRRLDGIWTDIDRSSPSACLDESIRRDHSFLAVAALASADFWWTEYAGLSARGNRPRCQHRFFWSIDGWQLLGCNGEEELGELTPSQPGRGPCPTRRQSA